MTTRHVGRRRRSRGPSRPQTPTRWENLFIQFAHTAAASQGVADLTPEPMAALLTGTATIKRAIMHFEIHSTAAQPAGGEFFDVGVGIQVVTNDAFLNVQPVISDPLSDFQQSWYYWTERTHFLTPENPSYEWEVEIHSMRKLRGGYKLIMTTENPITELAHLLSATLRLLWTVDV